MHVFWFLATIIAGLVGYSLHEADKASVVDQAPKTQQVEYKPGPATEGPLLLASLPATGGFKAPDSQGVVSGGTSPTAPQSDYDAFADYGPNPGYGPREAKRWCEANNLPWRSLQTDPGVQGCAVDELEGDGSSKPGLSLVPVIPQNKKKPAAVYKPQPNRYAQHRKPQGQPKAAQRTCY